MKRAENRPGSSLKGWEVNLTASFQGTNFPIEQSIKDYSVYEEILKGRRKNDKVE